MNNSFNYYRNYNQSLGKLHVDTNSPPFSATKNQFFNSNSNIYKNENYLSNVNSINNRYDEYRNKNRGGDYHNTNISSSFIKNVTNTSIDNSSTKRYSQPLENTLFVRNDNSGKVCLKSPTLIHRKNSYNKKNRPQKSKFDNSNNDYKQTDLSLSRAARISEDYRRLHYKKYLDIKNSIELGINNQKEEEDDEEEGRIDINNEYLNLIGNYNKNDKKATSSTTSSTTSSKATTATSRFSSSSNEDKTLTVNDDDKRNDILHLASDSGFGISKVTSLLVNTSNNLKNNSSSIKSPTNTATSSSGCVDMDKSSRHSNDSSSVLNSNEASMNEENKNISKQKNEIMNKSIKNNSTPSRIPIARFDLKTQNQNKQKGRSVSLNQTSSVDKIKMNEISFDDKNDDSLEQFVAAENYVGALLNSSPKRDLNHNQFINSSYLADESIPSFPTERNENDSISFNNNVITISPIKTIQEQPKRIQKSKTTQILQVPKPKPKQKMNRSLTDLALNKPKTTTTTTTGTTLNDKFQNSIAYSLDSDDSASMSNTFDGSLFAGLEPHKQNDLKNQLKSELKKRRMTEELLNQLQSNYDFLLERHAEAENIIDNLRVGSYINPSNCSNNKKVNQIKRIYGYNYSTFCFGIKILTFLLLFKQFNLIFHS
jgi:hypothetical protein